MTHSTRIEFDDGDVVSELVWVDDRLAGSIWTDGEGLGWNARAVSNIAGYWTKDATPFRTRDGALNGLLMSMETTWPSREQAEYNRLRIIEVMMQDERLTFEEAERLESQRFQRAIKKLFTPRP